LSERWSALVDFVVASAIPLVLAPRAVVSESRVGAGTLTEELLLLPISFLGFFLVSCFLLRQGIVT